MLNPHPIVPSHGKISPQSLFFSWWTLIPSLFLMVTFHPLPLFRMVNSHPIALSYGKLSTHCSFLHGQHSPHLCFSVFFLVNSHPIALSLIVNSHPITLSYGQLSLHRSFSHRELSTHRSFLWWTFTPSLFFSLSTLTPLPFLSWWTLTLSLLLMVNSHPLALVLGKLSIHRSFSHR